VLLAFVQADGHRGLNGHARYPPRRLHTDGTPAPDTLVEVLCEDHVGTYLLPYPCRSTAEGFLNERTGELIQVVGWREPRRSDRFFVERDSCDTPGSAVDHTGKD
jgi:hypothetical protein